MDETAREIERHIEQQRRELGDNVADLQSKVRDAFDWRVQMQERPLTMLAGAFAGGLLLSMAFGGRHREGALAPWADAEVPYYRSRSSPGTEYQKHQALETWNSIKGALIGVAAMQLKRYLAQAIPGFGEEYDKTTRQEKKAAGEAWSSAA